VRIGIVGTGWFGSSHAEVLRQLGCDIAACYGTNPPKTKEFAQKFQARIFASPIEMIAAGQIDAVVVAVPPFAHADGVEQAAIGQGLPLLVEKPIGLDLNLCRQIARQAASAGAVVAAGYLLRHCPLLEPARQAISRNRLTSIRGTRMSNFPPPLWWRRMETSGGPMVEQTTHQVDLIRYMFGEIQTVTAVTGRGIGPARFPGADVFDSMEALMTLEGGLIGSVGLASTFENGFSKIAWFEAFGQDFYLCLDGTGLRYKEGKAKWVEMPMPKDSNLLKEQDRQFLQAAADKNPAGVKSPYADALRTLEVTLAMNASAATGQTVKLPL
jgi:predicted dehydrogenase